MPKRLVSSVVLALLSSAPVTRAASPPEAGPDATVVRAHLAVASVRLTDNGDDDGFADPNETVQVYVTLRNGSGADRHGIVVGLASTDPTVDCILVPSVSFGSLAAGEVREGAVPLSFHLADVARGDAFQDLAATLEFRLSGNDFDSTTHPQRVVLDLDLNVGGGLLPSSFSEGFEGTSFGVFTTSSLDAGRESLALSDGFRCQYNDPDVPGSNSYGRADCFLGAAVPSNNGYDWHHHGAGSPDGGRAYLGNQSLHWGVHTGPPSMDTLRLRQLDAIRTLNPINLGWNGVASELSFKHQASLTSCESVSCGGSLLNGAVDRGIVQLQLATSAGIATGSWRRILPYENVYDGQSQQQYSNCVFDPVDDGSTEDDLFVPQTSTNRLGPSSTCYPEFAFSHVGATFYASPFDPENVNRASDPPGLQGVVGPGTWVQSRFDLSRWRGRRVRLRFLATSIEVGTAVTHQQALGWNPIEVDDGWYIDDVRVTNTLTSAATVAVDAADRSGLPACGPVCGSVTAALVATPEVVAPGEEVTLDASGSSADQCPGGALHHRFWREFDTDGVIDFDEPILQDWDENTVITHSSNFTTRYGVEVRCSTRPACQDRTTALVTVACPSIEPAPFPYTIRFDSPLVISWGTATPFDAIRGDLGALRASGGQFDGTVETCLWNDADDASLFDATAPDPGEGKYYLLRTTGFTPLCTAHSWTSGSPSEAPGAGGDRDEDLALDPVTCP